ncbi:MAG: YIP1 family protein [Halolamina sp.]
MLEVLTSPRTFFQSRTDDAGWLAPVAIVLTVAVVSAVGTVPAFQATTAALPADAGSLGAVVQAVSLVTAFATAFVVWVVYAGVFYAISAVFDGDGDFATLLKFVGWGYLPAVASAAVTAVVQFTLYSGRDLPSDPEAIAAFSQSVQTDPLFVAASVFGVVVTVYQGYIWSHAVGVARDLNRREALITAGIPVAISVLFSLSGFLL